MAFSKPQESCFRQYPFHQDGETVLIFQGLQMRKAQCIWVAVESKQVKYLVRYPRGKDWSPPRRGAVAFSGGPLWSSSSARSSSRRIGPKCQPTVRPGMQNSTHSMVLGRGRTFQDPLVVPPSVFCKDQLSLASSGWVHEWLPEGTVLRFCASYFEKNRYAYVLLQMAAERKLHPRGSLSSYRGNPFSSVGEARPTLSTKVAASPKKGRTRVHGRGVRPPADQPTFTIAISAAAAAEPDKEARGKQEFQVNLPSSLRALLVLDWELVTLHKKFCNLPARITVDTILINYAAFQPHQLFANKRQATSALVALIKQYFDIVLGTQLLYNFEKPQYAKVLARYPTCQMSQIYGGVHLLRLFPQMGSMLASTNLDVSSRNVLLKHFQDFLEFLATDPSQLVNPATDYRVTSANYQKKAE